MNCDFCKSGILNKIRVINCKDFYKYEINFCPMCGRKINKTIEKEEYVDETGPSD